MISIIIPIYNAEAYLEECINSVLKQSYKEYECILINDGSTDKSGNICDMYSRIDSRIKCYHQINQGVSVARNKGIELASGEYLYFLDADDTISHDCIELLTSYAKKYNNPDIIVSKIETFGISNIYYPFSSEIKYIEHSINIQNSYYKHEWYEMPVNKLIRKEFIINNNILFQQNIRHEDTLWSFITALYANTLLILPKTTYFYRIHNQSFITSRNHKLSSESLLVVCIQMKTNINRKGKKEVKNAMNYYIDFTTNVLISYFLNLNYPLDFKYNGYKTIRILLKDFSILSFWKSSYPIGIKLIQIHQLLPTKIGFYYICLYNRISSIKKNMNKWKKRKYSF